MEHRTSKIVGFGSSQVNLREDRFASTADLLALPTEHIIDHNIIDASKNEECASFGRPMLSLCHKTREQFVKEQHVVHNVEQVVELGLFVAWVEFDEQFSMFSDQTPYALDMVHRIRRPQLQDANNHTKAPEALHVVMQWVRHITTNNLAKEECEDGND